MIKLSSLIKLTKIQRTFSMGHTQVHALQGVDLDIQAGELLAIIGQSGSGKSTLMNIIGLLDSPTAGEYYLQEKLVAKQSDDDLAALRNRVIGFVFQSFFLLPRITALQNVCLPLFYREQQADHAKARALESLASVGMERYATHKPMQLSGGQQQRVAIARALVGEPKLLLADEPTGALDSITSQEVLDIFINLNRTTQMTTVIITHDEMVARQCDRVVQIQDGLIIADHGGSQF